MQNSLAMSVVDSAGNLCHQLHTPARVLAECRCCGAKTPARREFHAEKRQALLTFADLMNGKNVRVIEASDCFGFAPKTHQRLMGIHLMSEYAFHRDDPTGVLLPCAINHSHPAAADLFQNFVMTEA